MFFCSAVDSLKINKSLIIKVTSDKLSIEHMQLVQVSRF